MIIFPIIGAGGSVTRELESAASASIYLGIVAETSAGGAATVNSQRPEAARGAAQIRGHADGRMLLRVEVGTLQETPARSSIEAGTLQEAQASGAGDVAARIERRVGAALTVARAGEPSAGAASLGVGGEAAPLAAGASLVVRSLAPARGPRAAFTLVVSSVWSVPASLQISKPFELTIMATATAGRLQETPLEATIETRGGEGFTIAVDVLDSILATGRGNLC